MKIAVVGAGAMGSLFGAMLAEAGNEVWLYDVWIDHVQTIDQYGLSIEREGKNLKVHLKATADSTQIGQADLLFDGDQLLGCLQGNDLAMIGVSEGHVVGVIR